MSYRYSSPFEALIEQRTNGYHLGEVDFLIVGSGYGGAIAAARLAGAQADNNADRLKVMVLERGQEYQTGEFPNNIELLPKHIRVNSDRHAYPLGYPDALFDLHIGQGVDVLVGCGLGGTSLINANVAFQPDNTFFSKPGWPRKLTLDDSLQVAFEEVKRVLTPRQIPKDRYRHFNKSSALKKLARNMGNSVQISAADITVNFESGAENAVGIPMAECSGCGNCITGCNVGAKNTLMSTYIPLAEARGAKFYTGASVLSVEPIEGSSKLRWKVSVVRTRALKTPLESEIYSIHASNVILAAGSLGSTEILQRSSKLRQLDLGNPNLGRGFSTNGDAIAFSYGQNNKVNGVGTSRYREPHACGPTITTLSFFKTDEQRLILLEDGAVPVALADVFYQALPNLSLIQGLGLSNEPQYFTSHKNRDPLIAYREVQHHNQTFLLMTDDHCAGDLIFHTFDNTETAISPITGKLGSPQRLTDFNIGKVVPHWDVDVDRSHSHLKSIHEAMSIQNFKSGLNGGQYIPNPFWNLVPESADVFMEGNLNNGRLLTVHPLGGCRMADSGAKGVVNHKCQVFNGSEQQVHPGLYVMDGAVVPVSLGFNPFLTIAALSNRAMTLLLLDQGLKESAILRVEPSNSPQQAPPHEMEKSTSLQLRERLVGHLEAGEGLKNALKDCFNLRKKGDGEPGNEERIFQKNGVILDIEYDPDLTADALEAGKAMRFSVKMYKNPVSLKNVLQHHSYGATTQHLSRKDVIAEGEGCLNFMAPDKPGPLDKKLRTVKALYTYLKRRTGPRQLINEHIKRRDKQKWNMDQSTPLWKQFLGFWRIAQMQATYRDLSYTINLTAVERESTTQKQEVIIKGGKKLAWTLNHPRLWDNLLVLNSKLKLLGWQEEADLRLVVDANHFAGDGLLQARGNPSTPTALFHTAALAGLFFRGILQTNFWEFGSGGYPENGLMVPKGLPDLKVLEGTQARMFRPETIVLNVRHSEKSELTVPVQLHRYVGHDLQPQGQPLLLIHGLAQGSNVFTTTTLKKNMVQYFLQEKFDVWVMDYRISNRIYPNMDVNQKSGWSIDEIATYDIPAAISKIWEKCGSSKIAVMAHCVGSAAMQMAILKRTIESDQIKVFISHAIHPWLSPSAANRVRARLGNYAHIMLEEELLDPIPRPSDRNSTKKTLFDRLAFSLARTDEGENDEHARPETAEEEIQQAICDRMTLLYGRMWNHQNLTSETSMKWHELVGPAPSAVYSHLYYMVTRKRLLDGQGENTYLTISNIQKNWAGIPTLFIHGEDSQVFNSKSASDSSFFLKKVIGGNTTIGYKRFEGFGHLDCIIGHDAFKKIFPSLRDFISNPQSSVGNDAGAEPNHSKPSAKMETSAILRAAGRSGDRLELLYWMELSTFNTSKVDCVRVDNNEMKIVKVSPVESEKDYKMVEVTLHVDPQSYSQPIFLPIFDEPIVKGIGLRVKTGAFGSERKTQAADDNHALVLIDSIEPETEQSIRVPYWVTARFDNAHKSFAFLCGSCRYPGTPFEREMSDQIFHHMKRVAEKQNIEAIFMLGDQIYSDASADMFSSSKWRDRYDARYREAFNSDNFSELVAGFPTYFCVDDHEYTDNWSGEGDESLQIDSIFNIETGHLSISQFSYAKACATRYMGYGTVDQRKLWKELSDKEFSCPAFILDTRSEREVRKLGVPAALFGDEQKSSVLQWLGRIKDKSVPKLIFCGVSLAPLTKTFYQHHSLFRSEEGFLGYPDTLGEILDAIVQNKIKQLGNL